MRIGLISDIHGNISALEAVLDLLHKQVVDEILCLGDIVGYGPDASSCIDLLIDKKVRTVLGNHDAGVTGKMDLKSFRNPNRKLLKKTILSLTKDQREWLSNLPLTISDSKMSWIACHASPIYPEGWEYLNSAIKIRAILNEIDSRIVFVGHTHKPALVTDKIGNNDFTEKGKILINPGSVGQSRDRDYQASCAIVDLTNLKCDFFRVPYNFYKTYHSLLENGFSKSEADRLLGNFSNI